MSYTINKKDIFPYTKEDLKSFSVYLYEWVDNLHFTLSLKDCIDNYSDIEKTAEQIFLNAGWHGDGEIKFMWLPPFTLPNDIKHKTTHGITILHVKQKEDGLSWLLSPIPLDFLDEFKN
ncbi:MAG: hypothetical protein KF900_01130 [Bacteroidetes bacterium]|nr:hypothetical protein [Bacteroidota bacterium]